MPVIKHSLTVAGHRTSITLEEPFWAAFRAIAARRGIAVNELARQVDAARIGADGAADYSLSGAIRVFVLAETARGTPDSHPFLQ